MHTHTHRTDLARGQKWNPLFWLRKRLPVKLPQFISGPIYRSDSLCCFFFRELSLPHILSVWAGRRRLGRCLTHAACEMRSIHRATLRLEMKCQARYPVSPWYGDAIIAGVLQTRELLRCYSDRCGARVTGMFRLMNLKYRGAAGDGRRVAVFQLTEKLYKLCKYEYYNQQQAKLA